MNETLITILKICVAILFCNVVVLSVAITIKIITG